MGIELGEVYERPDERVAIPVIRDGQRSSCCNEGHDTVEGAVQHGMDQKRCFMLHRRGEEYYYDWKEGRFAKFKEPHIVIRKDKEATRFKILGMWRGRCTTCRTEWSYWSFGACLGSGLEHIRRCKFEVPIDTPIFEDAR